MVHYACQVPCRPNRKEQKEMKSENTTMRKRQLAAFFCALSCAFAASATNWYVSPDGTGGGTSPTDRGDAQVVVNTKMNAGDTVYFAPGTYTLDDQKGVNPNTGYGVYFRLGSSDNITNLKVIGESDNPEEVRLVGTPADRMRIFYCSTGGHQFRNLFLTGGYTDYQGAGICMADSFVPKHEQSFFVSNCIVENCSARYQGANRGGVWRDCVIRNNVVRSNLLKPQEGSGGGVFHATLYNCVITNNEAALFGGGIAGSRTNGEPNRDKCTTKAYNCLIGWNRAPYGGGAGVSTQFVDRTMCQLFNCTVISNTASMLGGGAYLCTISNSTVRGNYVPRTGTVYEGTTAAGGGVMSCNVLKSTLDGNGCLLSGGGAAWSSLTECTISNNTAAFTGGGTYLCTVSNSTIRGNASTWNAVGPSAAENMHARYRYGGGGGAMLSDIFDSVIETNTSRRGGAGAAISSLTRCRILNNVASGNPNGYGGGTYACPLVKDCVLAGNRANYGGAAFNGCLENCVITNNASTGVDGGATYNATSRNCIVVGNTAHRYYAHCRGAHYGDLVYGNKSENKNWDGVSLSAVASGIGADKENVNEGLPVVNCTVWNNLNGAAQVSRASLTNSIVMSVMAMDAHSAVNSFWRSGTVANQTGCVSGTDKDPKFVGVKVTDAATAAVPFEAYALRSSSPCRDTGMALPGQATEKDCLDNPRVKYAGVDMGALECFQLLGTYFLVR